MSHLDEATIVAVRDHAPRAAADDEHLGTCPACRAAVDEAYAREDVVASALDSLDVTFDLEGARATVRGRVAGHAASHPAVKPLTPRLGRTGWHLGRAAAALLVVAGAAAALPRSPVRAWLAGPTEPDVAPSSEEIPVTSSEAPRPETTTLVRVAAGDGPVAVTLRGVSAGAVVEVRWVAGDHIAVIAPTGTAFVSAEGRITADLTPGSVVIELARDVVPVSVSVQGRTYLSGTADGLSTPGPVETRAGDLIRFRVPPG